MTRWRHSRRRGALTPAARAAMQAAADAGQAGAPIGVLTQAQAALKDGRRPSVWPTMVYNLVQRGFLENVGSRNLGLFVATKAGREALVPPPPLQPRIEAPSPRDYSRRPQVLNRLAKAVLLTAEGGCDDGVPLSSLINVQTRYEPQRSVKNSHTLICHLVKAQLLRSEGPYLQKRCWLTEAGRQRLRSQADPFAMPALPAPPEPPGASTMSPERVVEAREPVAPIREAYVPPNSRQFIYDGRTVYVPRVRSVFDLGEALLLADQATLKPLQKAAA